MVTLHKIYTMVTGSKAWIKSSFLKCYQVDSISSINFKKL